MLHAVTELRQPDNSQPSQSVLHTDENTSSSSAISISVHSEWEKPLNTPCLVMDRCFHLTTMGVNLVLGNIWCYLAGQWEAYRLEVPDSSCTWTTELWPLSYDHQATTILYMFLITHNEILTAHTEEIWDWNHMCCAFAKVLCRNQRLFHCAS